MTKYYDKSRATDGWEDLDPVGHKEGFYENAEGEGLVHVVELSRRQAYRKGVQWRAVFIFPESEVFLKSVSEETLERLNKVEP